MSAKHPLSRTQIEPAAGLAEARTAWLDGRYAECLAQLDLTEPQRSHEHLEAALLRARVLLRTSDAAGAAEALRGTDGYARLDVDAADSIRTLRGIAKYRMGKREAGLALLSSPIAARDKYVIAERAYYHALALWLARDLNAAEKVLAAALDAQADVMYARALGLLGWIETSRGHYVLASRTFMDALAAGRSARHRDEHLLASMLHVLAGFAFELLDVHLARVVEREYEQVRWSEDLSVIHSYVLQARSSSALLAGDPHRAWTLLGEALAVTSEQAPLIHAHVTFASLHRVMGDSFAPRQHLAAARALIGQVVWSESTQDGRMALLEYAAEAARLNEGSAAQALMRYHSARKAVDSLASLEADPRAEALERHASALVARMNDKGATDQLRAAAGCWAKIGYHMRHGETLLDLHETQASADLLRQVAAIAKPVPRSWLNEEVKRRGLGSDKGSVLSAAERRVMAAICEGKSARQIAGELGRSVSTINNQTRAIYDALGVRSRAALIANYGAQAARSSATL